MEKCCSCTILSLGTRSRWVRFRGRGA